MQVQDGSKEYKKASLLPGRLDDVPKDWSIVTLKDIADIKSGKRVPLGDKLIEKRTKHPYIRVIDFKNSSVESENLKYLTEDTFEKISRYTVSSKDVYISIAGTIGLVGHIPVELSGANLTENAAKLCNLKGVKKEFLAYFLSSDLSQNQIKSFIGKSTQPKLALFRIEKLRILLPAYSEQERILSILSKVDELIQKTDQII